MTSAELRKKAEGYRSLALETADPQAEEALRQLAEEYDELAFRIEAASGAGAKPSEPPPPDPCPPDMMS